jgi:hypothetical protein
MKKLNPWFIASVIVSLAIWAVIIGVILLLTGCTAFAPQETLRKELRDYRELVVRLDGKVLNPEAAAEIPVYSETGEPVDAEVDVRVEVVGYWGVYKRLNSVNMAIAVLGFPAIPFGLSELWCAEHRAWETDTICTCQIWLATDSPRWLEHELRHCMGYGEH